MHLDFALGLVLLVFSPVSGAVAAKFAQRQGRSWGVWFLLGMIFGPIAWLIGLFPTIDRSARRQCPACAERVKIEARICRFCHTALKPEAPQQTRLRTETPAPSPPWTETPWVETPEQSHLRRRMERSRSVTR